MRVHANRDSALVLAAQASKAVPKITTIPELKGIHMEADARLAMLTMTATNQEVSIRASMPAAVEESGSAVIPADLLPDILKRLPGDQVSFSTVGPGIIHIGSGYAEYRLNILDAAKYPLPEVPFLEDTIPVSGICSLARQTLFAAAAGDQQNILKTVRLKVGPYGLKATSSNGFCIAEAAGDKNCVAASETCILVPARSHFGSHLPGQRCLPNGPDPRGPGLLEWHNDVLYAPDCRQLPGHRWASGPYSGRIQRLDRSC